MLEAKAGPSNSKKSELKMYLWWFLVVVPCLAPSRQFNAERRLRAARAPVNSNTAFRQGRLPATASPTRLSWYSDYSLDLRTMGTSEYSHSVLSDILIQFSSICITAYHFYRAWKRWWWFKSSSHPTFPQVFESCNLSLYHTTSSLKPCSQKQQSSTMPTKTSSPPSTTTSTKT